MKPKKDLTPSPFYAVMTEPRKEDATERRISALGARTFYPHIPEWADIGLKAHSKLIRQPLLPRYFFVDPTELGGRFDLIAETRGVSDIVTGASEEPMPIPMAVIHSIMKWCDPAGALMCSDDLDIYIYGKVRDTGILKVGETVAFNKTSPLQGLKEAISSIDRKGRLTVEIEMLGRKTKVSAPAEQCERATEATEIAGSQHYRGELITSPPLSPLPA